MSLENIVYVGTYTQALTHTPGNAEGIYRCRFDPETGALAIEQAVAGVANPSYLALDPQRRYLYAVEETDDYEGQASGSISAFAVDGESGGLTWLNRQPTQGTAPCHVSVDPSGRWVLAANYGSGSIAVYPVEGDGRLGAATTFIQHEGGSGVNPQRQQGPHAHMILPDPENRHILVNDLGLDQIRVYNLHSEDGTLTPNDPAYVETEPGGGPRHLAFNPRHGLVYLLNEMGSSLTTFTYDPEYGKLTKLGTLPTIPDDFGESNSCADIHLAPSGRFVYSSNRGHDSIAIFAVSDEDGSLTAIGHVPTGGNTPRNFTLDPSGSFLLVANQRSDTIVTFRVDQESGGLTPTGNIAAVPTPVCVVFAAG